MTLEQALAFASDYDGRNSTPHNSCESVRPTYNQVIFPHPDDGTVMLALERRSTVRKDGSVSIRSQPFGGGIWIINPTPLQGIIGKIQFDSERSKQEQDFGS